MKAIFVGGKYHGLIVDVDTIYRAGMWNGRFNPDYSDLRNRGELVPRAELDNQPKVDGYLGPMWDGDMLRYESQEVYNVLSC